MVCRTSNPGSIALRGSRLGAPRGRLRRGFTLVELLVVIGIIAVLIAILTPSLARTREIARRTRCLSNMRQITLAALAYATDDPDQTFIFKTPGAEDSLFQLYPKYLPTLDAAVCPSTDNVVLKPEHLKNNAVRGAGDNSGGHSYEVRGWVWGGITFPDGYRQANDKVKTLRLFQEPSRVCILMDADDKVEGDQNNWPDKSDNHGTEGFNVSYMDGHAEWAPTGRPLLQAYMNGYYNPNLPTSIYTKYGLKYAGNVFSWQ